MVKKLVRYSTLALKKPVYICAPILDPRQKLNAVTGFTMEELGFDKDQLVEYFTKQATKFKPLPDPDIQIEEPEPAFEDNDD
jgi:hypothetical protein